VTDRICSVEDCDRPHIARGFCTMHYRRWQKHGDPLFQPPTYVKPECSIDGCTEVVLARGWCADHYGRWQRNGDPLDQRYGLPAGRCIIAGCDNPGTGPYGFGWCAKHYRRYYRRGHPLVVSRIVGNDVARFETYIREGAVPEHDPTLGPCWLWTGALNPDGYGSMGVLDLPTDSAHRWSYRHHVGPLLDELELDHLCRVRRCVNPYHLEQVTHVVNLERANALR
jgi:hypothetical protein